MKVLTAEQIRRIDELTIHNKKISAVALMEQAAQELCDWLTAHRTSNHVMTIICGPGNNGGDGLALARLLFFKQYEVNVLLMPSKRYSPDNKINQTRLKEIDITINHINHPDSLNIPENTIIIDALFGTGMSRKLSGDYKTLVEYINDRPNEVIAIDLPSGLYAEATDHQPQPVVQANITLSFQIAKQSFYFAPQNHYIGDYHLLNIGLDQQAINQMPTQLYQVDRKKIAAIYRPRQPDSHKGHHGHALLIGGQRGMIGAIVLATSACLRTGAGKTSVAIPQCGESILQNRAPEAMLRLDAHETHISSIPDLAHINCIGIGPGIGTHHNLAEVLRLLLRTGLPIVIDADALNVISSHRALLSTLHQNVVLTPHPGEFDRLAGESKTELERFNKHLDFAQTHSCTVIVKGRYSRTITASGDCFFNDTGNSGLAKGGSGDVLTGMITGLLAQGYSTEDAAILGVYLHGLSADLSVKLQSPESLIASDVIDHIGNAYQQLNI